VYEKETAMHRRTFLFLPALLLPAALVRAEGTLRLIAFGDSNTWGMGATPRHRCYANTVAARLGRTLDNRAVNGTFVDAHLAAIQATTFAPGDLAIWLTGYNDMRGGTDLDLYAAQLDAGLAACAAPLWLGNCLRMVEDGYRDAPGGFGSDARVAEMNIRIAAVAARHAHVRLIDVCAAYDPIHNADLVHPDNIGHAQIADACVQGLYSPIMGDI
jgi:hypothetical protein